jgi:hypothetical protein
LVKCEDCKCFRELEESDERFMCFEAEYIFGACESTSPLLKIWREYGEITKSHISVIRMVGLNIANHI